MRPSWWGVDDCEACEVEAVLVWSCELGADECVVETIGAALG